MSARCLNWATGITPLIPATDLKYWEDENPCLNWATGITPLIRILIVRSNGGFSSLNWATGITPLIQSLVMLWSSRVLTGLNWATGITPLIHCRNIYPSLSYIWSQLGNGNNPADTCARRVGLPS